MKIGYVTTFLPQRCGIATYTDYLIHGLQQVDPNIDIRVIAENQAEPVREKSLEVRPCWDRKEDYSSPILEHAVDLDVLHIQHEYSIYSFDNRLPRLLEKLSGPKSVITIHCIRPSQFSPRGSVDEKYAGRIAELADEVIVHLETQESILTRLGIPEEKITVISHGTEHIAENQLESRRKLQLPEEGKILLMFGFVKPHKCLHIALEALSQILEKRNDVFLFVAGALAPTASEADRSYLQEMETKIKNSALSKNVIFPNSFFPNEDVPYIFSASDIVLFPYYEEDRSASGAFHLSIGADRPVVACRIPKFENLKKICDELLILPYNSSGIADVILRLLDDPEFSHYIHQRLERYKTQTSWSSTAKKILEVYNK